MSITNKIAKEAEVLRAAESSLKAAIERYEKVRSLGGQQGYSITIDGVSVMVATMDRYYSPKLIRGREMIHLGALKALDAEIDGCRERIKSCRLALSSMGEDLAQAAAP